MKKRTWLSASGTLLLAALAACATPTTPRTLPDTAAATPGLSMFNRLIADAGLADTLRAEGPYTVFAPSDEAFKAVPQARLAALAKDRHQLRAMLSHHVVRGRITAAEVKNGNVKTMEGSNVALSKAGAYVTVEDAVVIQSDVMASNGVVHVVDRVLGPPKNK
jgi:uncharacterized surface protein with fasciclin (FAS1) repeats